MLLTNSETFLSEMSKLFYANQTKGGTLYITMKRLDNSKKPKPRENKKPKKNSSESSSKQQKQKQPQTQTTSVPDDGDKPKEYKCLIRVHDSKRKISIIVSAKDVNKFQQAYSNLLRGNLYGLKKKDKKKQHKKSKATQ